MSRVLPCFAILCMLLASGFGRAQSGEDALVPKRLDHIVQYYADHDHFMGTVLVARGDHLLLNKGYGEANLEWQIANTPETEFIIGSDTKQFTAAVILRLQELGKLKLTDAVSKYLPQIPGAWGPVTIQNMLNHTSGVADVRDARINTFSMESHTLPEQLEFIRGLPVDFNPGTKYGYSNANYTLLAMVAEAATKRPFKDLLNELILVPAGLKHTFFDTDALLIPKRAQGYEYGKAGFERTRIWSMSAGVGVGNLVSTTGDLLLWERALFHGGLLRPESLAAMTTPGRGNYGFGVEIAKVGGERYIGHGGSIMGFFSWIDYLPQRDLTVIVLCNSERSPRLLRSQLIETVQGLPVVLANETAKPSPDLTKLAGAYSFGPEIFEGHTYTVAVDGSALTVQAGRRKGLAIYEGSDAGRLRFSVPEFAEELEFLSDKAGNTALYLPSHAWGLMTKAQQ